MKMNLDWRQVDIRWFAVAASLLLSITTLFSQEVPNSDAYTYARTAEIFLADGLKAAYQHYSWASYSILIGIVSWSGLDVFSAGLLVNALFYALLVYAFLSIAKEIKDSRALLLLAAISILVYPQLNEYREPDNSRHWLLGTLTIRTVAVFALHKDTVKATRSSFLHLSVNSRIVPRRGNCLSCVYPARPVA